MNKNRYVVLLVVALLIIVAIFFLESENPNRGGAGDSEIDLSESARLSGILSQDAQERRDAKAKMVKDIVCALIKSAPCKVHK